MWNNFVKKIFSFSLITLLSAAFLFQNQAHAGIYDGVRSVSWKSSNSTCKAKTLKFDPLTDNKDLRWDFSNAVCLVFTGGFGASIYAASKITDAMCTPTNDVGIAVSNSTEMPVVLALNPELPTITFMTAIKILLGFRRCASRGTESAGAIARCSAAVTALGAATSSGVAPAIVAAEITRNYECAQVPLAANDVSRCCAAIGAYALVVAGGVTALAITYAVAKGAYENARICGHDWYNWAKVDDDGNEEGSGVAQVGGLRWKRGKFGKSYKQCLIDLFAGEVSNRCGISPNGRNNGVLNKSRVIANKYYREFIYGGKEVQDSGEGQCKNPSSWDSTTKRDTLGYNSDRQRYYMTGPNNASNFSCYRFLSSDQTDDSAQDAYNCCLKRSQTAICIESRASLGIDGESAASSAIDDGTGTMASGVSDGMVDNGIDPLGFTNKFCKIGSRCNVANVWYEVYISPRAQNFACAKTYSVCPYNHPLGGGSESEAFYEGGENDGKTKNFCQVRNHCSKIPINPYIRTSNLEGAFISAACRDLKGDTQNIYAHNANLLITKNRNFSAPMAQCFKETMENLFLNRAGHTKCSDDPNAPGITIIPDSNGECEGGSYEYRVGSELDTPSFFIKIQDSLRSTVKIGLTISVMILGFTILFGLAPITKKQLMGYIMKIALVMYFAVGDGWQAGFMDGVMGTSGYLSNMMFKLDESPNPQKLDGCQFPKFNHADDNPATMYDNPSYPAGKKYLRMWDVLDCKLAKAIGYSPGVNVPNLVKMILGGLLTGGLGIVFLIAAVAMAFFLFSIIVRALHIFILSTTAIIILLYVSPITITLAMFARTKSIFDGWWKQLLGFILQPVILFAYLGILLTFFDMVVVGDAEFSGGENGTEKEIICSGSAKDTSIYCIFQVAKTKDFVGLEIIGIGLPVLTNMNKAKFNTIMNAAFMLFIFMAFLDKITTFSSELVGGAGLESDWNPSASAATKSAYKVLRGVQERGARGAKKAGGAAYGKTKEVVRNRTSLEGGAKKAKKDSDTSDSEE